MSHIGIGLNRYLKRTVDWVLVDEHRAGDLLIAFRENGYIGGENASSLNVDFVTPNASLHTDSGKLVGGGRRVV